MFFIAILSFWKTVRGTLLRPWFKEAGIEKQRLETEAIYQSGDRELPAGIRKLLAHFMLPRCARPERIAASKRIPVKP